jgi:hypothetical protein
LQSLAGGTEADAEAFFQVLQGERQRGDEQQCVDFRDRARLPQSPGKLDENLDLRGLHRGQSTGSPN